jgi:cbb3-type cytochrome oxidase subunit 3
MNVKNFFNDILEIFDDKPTDEPVYDAVHFGSMIVLVIFSISIVFWLLWSLLVFGGGIQSKVQPCLEMIFTAKTAADFGYVGYPYEMGAFEGWPTNVAAFIFTVLIISGIWHLFNKKNKDKN